MCEKIRVTVFCEHNQDRREPVKSVYPDGMHETIADAFRGHEPFEVVHVVTQDMPEHGLTAQVLADTDVLVWWSHLDNPQFDDAVADRVIKHVIERGMGFLSLHSSIFSKPWQKMLGIYYDGGYWGRFRTTPGGGERQRVWVTAPGHPITAGLDEYFEVPQDEMYGEPQLIPEPDRTVFISWWEGGEVGRSGCVYERGRGKLFQFTPGHEEFPIFYQEEVRLIMRNAVKFLAPAPGIKIPPVEGGYLDNTAQEEPIRRRQEEAR